MDDVLTMMPFLSEKIKRGAGSFDSMYRTASTDIGAQQVDHQ